MVKTEELQLARSKSDDRHESFLFFAFLRHNVLPGGVTGNLRSQGSGDATPYYPQKIRCIYNL